MTRSFDVGSSREEDFGSRYVNGESDDISQWVPQWGSQSPQAQRPYAMPRKTVRDAMLNGTPGQRKALLKELIVEVRVESRDSIIPTFRLPTTSVRVTETVVGLDGLEPSTSRL